MKQYDYIIVGSGLFGSVFAYKAHQAGKKCLVLEKRPHLGGNVYCECVEGINVHKYGAHIFHTSNRKVWDFVNLFVDFNRYTNSPVANYKGQLYNLPFNMNTFHQMWGVTTPEEAQEIINEQKTIALEAMRRNGVMEPRNLEEQAQLLIGKDIYDKLIKGYTEKQWGRKCEDLPAFIIKRLPVRFVFDNNYFNDIYQGIPIGGYNRLIEGLLAGIETKVNTDLPVSIAKTAKENGVKQFVFMSTMGVFGKGKALLKEDSVVTKDTVPNAVGGYGGSKLQAEKQLNDLESDSFKVAIVRPPNVYGPGCRGNYIPLFKKLALKLYICPYAFSDIRQSMLYIDNLCELVRLILDTQSSGLFFPQDDIAPSTVELIKTIRGVYGKRTHYSRIFGFVVKICSNLSIIKKIYGGIQYKSELSNHFDSHYQIVKFITGIQNTINYKEE